MGTLDQGVLSGCSYKASRLQRFLSPKQIKSMTFILGAVCVLCVFLHLNLFELFILEMFKLNT